MNAVVKIVKWRSRYERLCERHLMDLPVLSKRLREARLAAGISQKQLGIAAGIDEFSASPRINQYERGKHVPDFSVAERLAAVLNVPTPYLFTRDEDLAKVILMFGQLDGAEKEHMLEVVKMGK